MSISTGPRPRHPALAAVLSFVFPGLGHVYAGQLRTALLLGVPILALVAAMSAAVITGWSTLRNDVLSSSFLWSVIAVDLVLLGWRLFAISHAWLKTDVPEPRTPALDEASARGEAAQRFPVVRARLVTERLRQSPFTKAVVGVMLVATLGMHAYVAVLAGTLNATLGTVFTDAGEAPRGDVVGGPVSGGPEGPDLHIPDYRWDGTERINFLLVGVDYAPGREHALDDTVLVASIDPVAQEAVLVSIPRDTAYLPLPDQRIYLDGMYPRRINELSTEARNNPDVWCPGLDPGVDCGVRALQQTASLYLGIPIHHFARVDLEGFSDIIDAVGGVEVCLEGRLVDPEYTGPDWHDRPRGISINPGCQELAGPEALAFARIRKGYIELPDGTLDYQSDFKRAARQQELLLALRRELARVSPFELPGVIAAVGDTLTTDFERSMAGDLASLIPLITRTEVDQVVLGYPDFVDAPPDGTDYYVLTPRREAIRAQMTDLFGEEGPLYGWYLGTDAPAAPLNAEAPPEGS